MVISMPGRESALTSTTAPPTTARAIAESPHNDRERQQQFTAVGRAQERNRYAAMVLAEFDKQERQKAAPIREERAEIRRKAKESL